VTYQRAEILYVTQECRFRVETAALTPVRRLERVRGVAVVPAPAPGPARPALVEPAPPRLERPIRVGIVDDSKPIRMLLQKMLAEAPGFEVVWEVGLPSQALREMQRLRPDVITLDLHMPEMNGVQLLESYMETMPIPTVVISSLSKDESPLVFAALENGAVDYVQKPSASDWGAATDLIVDKVRAAAQAKIQRKRAPAPQPRRLGSRPAASGLIVAIGGSTGGTEALREILTQLPAEIPPVVIVQHIPAVFSLALANRLNELCPFAVKEAEDGDELLPGRVLIAPGGRHLEVRRHGSALRAALLDSEPVNRHRPSVDVLFDSVAAVCGSAAIGVILTGMGADGARGMLAMREAGARTFAQDEESCVVFGMPKEAIRLGGVDKIVGLSEIPEALMRAWHSPSIRAKANKVG
jgi:two-component system chemotaxis response regulator CheB